MNIWRSVGFAVTMLAVAAAASAQRGMGRGPMGPMHYDVATEVTLTTIIDEVKTMPAPGRGPGGVHLMISTPSGPMEVHVGPAAFLEANNAEFAKGDWITVIGSKVKMGDADVVLARQITKGQQVLLLRDEKGFPLWSGAARFRN